MAAQYPATGWVSGDAVQEASAEYIELPARLISPLRSTTLLVWFSWTGDSRGALDSPRLFQFGSGAGSPSSFWWLSPSGDNAGTPGVHFHLPSKPPLDLDARAFSGGAYCYGAVFDADDGSMLLVVAGQYFSEAKGLLGNTLAALDDASSWLGRSPSALDSPFIGSIDEFRIYDEALSLDDIEWICGDPN